jgi:hypothetical protein
MAAAGQKSVCGLRYRGSRVRTKNSNLIDKKVSRRIEKLSTRNRFLPFFPSLLLCNKRERAAEAAGQELVCELRYHRSRVGPRNSTLIEKNDAHSNQLITCTSHNVLFFL